MEYLVSLSWLASNHSDYKMLLDHYLQWRRPPRYVYNFPSTVTSPEEPTCTFTSIDFPKVSSKLAHLKSYVRESDLLTQILEILTLNEQWNHTVDSNDAYFHLVFSCFQLISKARNCRIAFVNEGKDTFYQLFRVVGQNHVKDNNIIPFIVSGQTGSGKSVLTGVVVVMVTLKPIIVCQPRVLPATKLSNFINDLCDSDFPLSGYRTGNKNTNIPVHSPRFIEVQTAAFTSKFLTNNSNLSRFATIMVDEVHERKCDIDILLAQMRIISQTDSKLRVVICSATMDKPNPCFNYLTQGNYLDTEPSYTIHAAGRTNPLIVLDVNFVRQNEFHYGPLISKLVITPIFEPTLQQVFNDHFIDIYTYFVLNVNLYYDYFTQNCNPLSYKSINFRALARLCLCYYSLSQKLFQFEPECAGFTLLVFLPGSPEITTLSNIIENEYETSSEKPGVYPLYSSLDSVQQDAAVAEPARKQFKIVIATNIAESSLTIDGVKFVIDCGLSKQTDADDLLDTHHCSIASLDQRSGRAGRNSPGLSLRLVQTNLYPNGTSRLHYDEPEILNCSLIEPLLTIKQIAENPQFLISNRPNPPEFFISQLPDVPSSDNIISSVDVLFRTNVLSKNQLNSPLTYLGKICTNANISFYNFKFLFFCLTNNYLCPGLILLAGINSMSFIRCSRTTFMSFYDLYTFSQSIPLLKQLSTIEESKVVRSDMFFKLSLVHYFFCGEFIKNMDIVPTRDQTLNDQALKNLSKLVFLKKLERYLNELRSLVSRFVDMEDSNAHLNNQLKGLEGIALKLVNFISNPSEVTLNKFQNESTIFSSLLNLQIQRRLSFKPLWLLIPISHSIQL
ncbi:hypothetical protein GEMRC1_006984 [Eukaryota sp. GEM-RC1]